MPKDTRLGLSVNRSAATLLSRRSYGPLPAGFASAGEGRICIVTNELHGLFKNGGIGTANTGLALTLAEAGFSVTVAFSSWSGLPDREAQQVRDDYRRLGIEVELITETPTFPRPYASPQSASYAVYLYLRERNFDAVYFHENCGRGFYSLLAKHTGVFANAPLMFVVCHGPHEWVYELNSVPYYDKEPLIYAYLERRSVELADAVISPSRYLVDWMAAHGWKLPAQVFVEQNIVRTAAHAPKIKAGPIKELVFFGRTEMRKGVVLFCDAIDLLAAEVDLSDVRITFLGKFSKIEGVNSGIYMLERSRRWSSAVRFLARLGQDQALEYLARSEALAVIPSLAENSPCVVAECLQLGLPFVATDSGGTAELVPPEHRRCLTAADPRALAAKLATALKDGQAPASMAVPPAETAGRWVRFLHKSPIGEMNGQTAERGARPVSGPVPLVSVCLVNGAPASSGPRPCLEALLAQTYPNLEIILVDTSDRPVCAPQTAAPSGNEPARTFKMIEHGGLGSAGARNLAAENAQGAYLLFIDEAVIPATECVETLVEAARRTSAAVLTSLPRLSDSATPRSNRTGMFRFPLGPCPEIGTVENCFGHSIALVECNAFKAVGGFPAINDEISGFWQFFAAAVLAGKPLEVVPTPLFDPAEQRAADQTAAALVKSRRATLRLYRDQPIALVANLQERFADTDMNQQERLDLLIGGLDGSASDRIVQLSRLDPESPEALEGFVQYCFERGKSQEALEFVFYNGITSSNQIRWVKKESVIQFEWPSKQRWEIELRLGRLISTDQDRRIAAYFGERELPLRVRINDGNKTCITITGFRGSGNPGQVTVRIHLPGVYRTSDPAVDFGFAINQMLIRPAQETEAVPVEEAPFPFAELASRENKAPSHREIIVERDGERIRAESVVLDDYYSQDSYRHIDVSIKSVTAGGEDWPSIKFKFCRSGANHHLEFREALGWPNMFVEFPGMKQDDYGFVARFSPSNAPSISKWSFERDKRLLATILHLLADATEIAIGQSQVEDEEKAGWLAEARQFSDRCLQDLGEAGIFNFSPAETTTIHAAG